MYSLKQLQVANEFHLTLVSLNLGAVCMGMTLGSSESSLAYFILPMELYSKVSKDDQSIQTSMTLGVGFGALLPVLFVDIYGRRTSFAISSIVNAISWITLALTKSRTANIATGFVAGCAGGIFQTTTALYIPEISSPKNRATVSVLVALCSSVGMVLTNTILIMINFKTFAAAMLVMPMTFLMSIVFCMIESPYFLYQRGKVLDAKLSLKALRGAQTVLEVDEEITALRNFFNMDQILQSDKNLFHLFCPKNAKRKSLALVLILLFVSQIVAGYAIDDYAMEVIELKVPHYGNIVFSILDVIMVLICLYIVDKIGRKPLLMLSVIGSATCCFVLATYRVVLQKGCQETYNCIVLPAVVMVTYYAIYSLGFIPILPVLGGEIFPNRIKTIAVGLSMMLVYIIAVGIQRLYSLLKYQGDVCFAFVVFTLLGSIGLPIAVMALPQTMGKNLYEIQDEIEDMTLIMS